MKTLSILLIFLTTLMTCSRNEGKLGNTNENADKIETWVHHFTKQDDDGSLLAEGDAYMERHTATDSMYVYVVATAKHDFGTVSVQCLVPGTFSQEGDSCSFAYGDKIRLVCEFMDDCKTDGNTPTLEEYKAWFSVARVVPVDSMKEMAIISSSENDLVLEGRYNDNYSFDFKRTEISPSRMEIWKDVKPQRDEILAVSNMGLSEFWESFF